MNKKLTLALGAAALAAVLAQPAQAGHPGLSISVGLCPPPPAVVVAPTPAAPVYTYHYYPGQQVYHDPLRGQYFWPSGGRWLWGPSPPPHLVLGPRHLTVRLPGPWPHHHHQHRWQPPHGPRHHW
ncbi:MAG: hypothetical protein HY794_14695 [Desulfarculus sp.]|nr:hypothetical protein [Desulfarculus sp.]